MDGKIAYFNHDKYGGATLCRRVASKHRYIDGCAWCGNYNGWGKLFEFGVRASGTLQEHTFWNKGLFCSHECYHSYHG